MITLENAIQQFLVDQELKGNTEKTINFYDNCLRYYKDFAGSNINVKDITIGNLNEYLLMLKKRPMLENHPYKPKQDRPIDNVSIQTYIRAVRSLLGWLYREGYIETNLQEKYKLPKATKKVVEILSDEEIELLMKTMKTTTEMGLRNSCIVALMLDCGLRRNEALSLDVNNVHISQGILKVAGKGQKERIVPMGVYTKKLLLKYISSYRSKPEFDTNKLFLSKDYSEMSENAIKQLFTRLRKRTNIDRLHPHILRHTFATKYLMNGGDIFSLQQILGHTDLSMVRKYSHLASAYIVNNHKAFSPLDNLYKKKK